MIPRRPCIVAPGVLETLFVVSRSERSEARAEACYESSEPSRMSAAAPAPSSSPGAPGCGAPGCGAPGCGAPGCDACLQQPGELLPLIKGVLFDLDGTLIDSEPVYWENDQVFLAQYGIDFTEELNETMFGWGAVDFFTKLQHLFPLSPLNRMPLVERMRLKDEAYLEFGKDRIRPFPGVAAFASLLVGRRVPVAIASGSSPLAIDRTLGYAGLGGLFSVKVSTVDVPKGKPAPDVFLEAARRLGVDPALCLVLEDSVPGVQAAKAAGMACIALPAPVAPVVPTQTKGWDPGFALADMVVPGGALAFCPAMAGQAWRFA